MSGNMTDRRWVWPELPLSAWKETYATLHLWTQIVGKIRLALAPQVNHWWNTPLYVTARGLTTSAMPYAGRTFEVVFDFVDHRLVIETSDGRGETLPLSPMTVAEFYAEFISRLKRLDIDVHIWAMPCEIEDAVPFDHAATDWQLRHSRRRSSNSGADTQNWLSPMLPLNSV